MPSQKNIQQVEKLSRTLEDSTGLIFLDYQGLNHRQLEDLRNKVAETGSKFHVTKNTLLAIVLKNIFSDLNSIQRSIDDLSGSTATMFLGEDIISPIKKLVEFIKQNESPTIKSGLLDTKYLSLQKIQEIADLPSAAVLFSKLIGQIQAPLYNLARVLSVNIHNLVYVLSAVQTAKENTTTLRGGDSNGRN